ncbi:S26 family signal peptidase [Halobacteriales archaeon QS_1_68_20]|nr:MAG: S26 family signal peptidase [Halobacteriales archaeon QS_1_68_20]
MTGDDSGSSDDSGPGRDRPRGDGPPGGPADESDEQTDDPPRDDRDRQFSEQASDPPAPQGDSTGVQPGRDGDRAAVQDDGETTSGQRSARPDSRRDDGRQRERAPPRRRSSQQPHGGRGIRFWIHRFRTAESGPLMVAREVLSSVLMVVAVGLLLFAISGVWPPMVAIQSGSMEPHMEKGDLVFVVEEGRFANDAAVERTGVAPHAVAEEDGYEKFGNSGDVIIFKPDGSTIRDPIIHRAMFWVDEGENWYDKVDQDHIRADSCRELSNCPAPNSGFITKGDNNPSYDQAQGMSRPVRPGWITGKAMIRVPLLGWIRLIFSNLGHATAFALGTVAFGSGFGLRRRPLA